MGMGKWIFGGAVAVFLVLVFGIICSTPTPITPTATPPSIPLTQPPPVTESQPDSPPQEQPQTTLVEARVVRVIDGDTIEVAIDSNSYKVRYIGIDTPEAGQPCADKATEANRSLVEGKVIRLERNISETDNYGRLLRYVYIGDTFVNAELVSQGYAWSSSYPPDARYQEILLASEFKARILDIAGLWDNSCFIRYENPNYHYSICYPQVWKVLDCSERRLILIADQDYSVVTIHVSEYAESIAQTAEFYEEYLEDITKDEWRDLTITYSRELSGKWEWVIGFTFTDIMGTEPLEGIGEAYIKSSDGISLVVQWDGPEVLSDECKRIVDSFLLPQVTVTAPPPKVWLEIVSVTSPVSPGQYATLKARAPPGAQCTIAVYYKSGRSQAQGLYPKQADSNGDVSWTWKVGTRTTPGSWRIVVTAAYNSKPVSQETYFTVRYERSL